MPADDNYPTVFTGWFKQLVQAGDFSLHALLSIAKSSLKTLEGKLGFRNYARTKHT